jgi:hypothetical protein
MKPVVTPTGFFYVLYSCYSVNLSNKNNITLPTICYACSAAVLIVSNLVSTPWLTLFIKYFIREPPKKTLRNKPK